MPVTRTRRQGSINGGWRRRVATRSAVSAALVLLAAPMTASAATDVAVNTVTATLEITVSGVAAAQDIAVTRGANPSQTGDFGYFIADQNGGDVRGCSADSQTSPSDSRRFCNDDFQSGNTREPITLIDARLGAMGDEISVANEVSAALKAFGEGGNDTLFGRGAADLLVGNDGSDTFHGGTADYSPEPNGVSVFIDDLDNDGQTGTNEDDNVRTSVKRVIGTAQADVIGPGANTGILDQTLDGRAGADTVRGGAGDDTVVDSDSGSADMLSGDAGTDMLDLSGRVADLTADLDVAAQGTDDSMRAGNDEASGFENAIGGSAADTLRGTSGPNELYGGPGADAALAGEGGNDLIDGGAGQDKAIDGGDGADELHGGPGAELPRAVFGTAAIQGGAGNDTLDGGPETNEGDTLDGGPDADTLDYSARTAALRVSTSGGGNVGANDVLTENDVATNVENVTGGTGSDQINGDGGPNVLIGDPNPNSSLGLAGADTILGAGGIDTLQGARGGDFLLGGGGNDSLEGGYESDRLNGGLGTDRIDGQIQNLGLDEGPFINDTVEYDGDHPGTSGVTVDLVAGTASVRMGTAPAEADTLFEVENAVGTSFDDTLAGNARANVIRGGAGADALVGHLGNDTLDGDLGVDTADYSAETTRVVATLGGSATTGAGATAATDTLVELENLTGGSAGDDLTGDSGQNSLSGGGGNDGLHGNGEADTLSGGPGEDFAEGAGGGDTIDGGTEADALRGEAGPDSILSRDDIRDEVDCGDDADTVDNDLIDLVAADCEQANRPQPPPPPGGNEPPPGGNQPPPGGNQPPPGGNQPPPVEPDRLAPTVSAFSVTNRTFAVGTARTPRIAARRRAKKGTTFRYTLSEAARVTIVIDQLLPGRKVGGRCVKETRRNRRAKRCVLAKRVGTLTRSGAPGQNRVPFSGRLGAKKLNPGSYRATVQAVDPAGNRSRPVAVALRVIAR